MAPLVWHVHISDAAASLIMTLSVPEFEGILVNQELNKRKILESGQKYWRCLQSAKQENSAVVQDNSEERPGVSK